MSLGDLTLGMARALADDVRKMVIRETAPEHAKNPKMLDVVRACAAGLAFHQLLASLVANTPEPDRAMVRMKILEWAENTAAGLPTPLPRGPRQ